MNALVNLAKTAFIKSIVNVPVKYSDKGHSYNELTHEVEICSDEYLDGFMRHLHIKHGCTFYNKIHPQVWAMLHELGHHYTCRHVKQSSPFLRIMISLMDDEKIAETAYFGLPDEWAATEWAIKYCKAHPHKVKTMSRIIKRLG